MGYTLQQTINWAQTFIEYSPLTAGTNSEPAISIATMVRNTILNAPFTWPWNRNEFALTGGTALIAGQQDYTVNITDFAYLEKVSLLTVDSSYGWELKDVYNTNILGIPATGTTEQAQPNAAAVKLYTPGTSVVIRFLPPPDQAYTGAITYQQLSLPFQVFTVTSCGNAAGGNTSYTGTFNAASFVAGQIAQIAGFVTNVVNNGSFTIVSCNATTLVVANSAGVAETHSATAINESWFPIPDSFMDIYNNLFLAEAMAVVDDTREQTYRMRGIAALLAKSEGLTEMQRNAFLAQWLSRGSTQTMVTQLRNQQGSQARGV